MSKLKNIQKKYGMLNESFAWERQEGKPLPTLKDVQAAYNARSINEQEDTADSAVESKSISHIDYRKNGGPDLTRVLSMYKDKLRKLKIDTRKTDDAAFTIKELTDLHRHMSEFLKMANRSLEQQVSPAGTDDTNPFSI